MYRPSPQIPHPSPRAAAICYDSCAYIINLAKKQMDMDVMDITWVFLVTLSTALNTLLWSTSYENVRQNHAREEVEENINIALDCMERCSERWPGASSASQLYAVFSRACLQSYDGTLSRDMQPMFSFASPSSAGDQHGSPPTFTAGDGQQVPFLNPPHFGYVFDSPPESMNTYTFDPNFPPPQPSFRSNSIFCNPTNTDSHGRRFSYFPPDFSQPGDSAQDEAFRNMVKMDPDLTSPSDVTGSHLPTPPESIPQGNLSATTPSTNFSPPMVPTSLADASASLPMASHAHSTTPPLKHMIAKADPSQQDPTFTMPPQVSAATQQRPLPTTMGTEWFSSLPPFISPYNLGSGGLFNTDGLVGNNLIDDIPRTGMGFTNPGLDAGPPYGYPPARHGSLSQSQQLELMNVLETEGINEIDAILNSGNSGTNDSRWY